MAVNAATHTGQWYKQINGLTGDPYTKCITGRMKAYVIVPMNTRMTRKGRYFFT